MSNSTSMTTAALSYPSVTLYDAIAAIPCLINWRNSKGRIMPVHWVSAPGMSKTMLAEIVAKRIAKDNPGEPVGCKLDNLGIRTPADVPGFTLFDNHTNPDGSSERVSVFTRPTIFSVNRAFTYAPTHHDADSEGYVESTRDDRGQPLYVGSMVMGKIMSKGITILDEFMQSDVEVRKVAAPLVDEGRVADHYLPRDWIVWAASNRARDASGTGRALAFLTNRWCQVELKLTIDMTENYFNGLDVLSLIEPITPTMMPDLDTRGRVVRNAADVDSKAHPAWLAYFRQNQDTLYAGVPNDPGKPFLSPRSGEAGEALFNVMLRLAVGDPATGAMPAGASFAESFIGRRDSGVIEGISGDPMARWRVFQAMLEGTIGMENAAQFLGTLELFDEVPTLAEMIANPKGAHVSEKADAQFIAAYMISNGMTRHNADALLRYGKRLAPGLFQNIVHNAVSRDSEVLMAPSVSDWMNTNPDAMLRMMQMRFNANAADARKHGVRPTR